MNTITIICIGDIVGKPGRQALQRILPELKESHKADFVIANIENAAGGFGVTERVYKECSNLNIQAFTSGNHIFDKKEIMEKMPEFTRLIRPANFPEGCPGNGYKVFKHNTTKIGIINLMGRVFMGQYLDCPFRAFDTIYNDISNQCDIVCLDFHAETTSEKQAMFWHVDGRSSLAWGTHTHVQTADYRVFPSGLGCITDLGMTGVENGILGMEREPIVRRFLTQLPQRFMVPKLSECIVNGLVATIDLDTKTCTYIQNIYERLSI